MQTRILLQLEVRQLLAAMVKHETYAEIDWVNRTIRVLSEEKTNSKVQLSTGPMVYQDILFEINQQGVS